MAELEKEAMEILMMFARQNCTIMDSGGKDSSVLKRIAEKCSEKYGLEFKVVHNHTTIDAPETVYFIRRERERERRLGHPYEINMPEISFDRLCLKKQMLPTRIKRFCCAVLKERPGNREDRTVTGVRKAESTSRSKNAGAVTVIGRKRSDQADGENIIQSPKGGLLVMNYDNDDAREFVETCFRTNRVLINPLINWEEDDIWKYIKDERLPINPLYECGWKRVGCVGCPMAGYKGRVKEFERYPKYRERYIRIADRIVEQQKKKRGDQYNGLKTGLLYFKKWIEDPNTDGQFSFDEEGNITEDYT